jgi:hypothetical protein
VTRLATSAVLQPLVRWRLVALFAADTFFLWMFLAAAPLERMADASQFVPDSPSTRERAYAYAASWRHGMAGNSPLYMPGFFALALAVWFWVQPNTLRRLLLERLASLFAASAFAWMLGPLGARNALAAFSEATQTSWTGPIPRASVEAVAAGAYTAIAWTSFVAGSRLALARRSFGYLLPVPVLTIGLAIVRPWTVDDFASFWISQSAAGDAAATMSWVAIPIVAALLVCHERQTHRVHIRRSSPRTVPEE